MIDNVDLMTMSKEFWASGLFLTLLEKLAQVIGVAVGPRHYFSPIFFPHFFPHFFPPSPTFLIEGVCSYQKTVGYFWASFFFSLNFGCLKADLIF